MRRRSLRFLSDPAPEEAAVSVRILIGLAALSFVMLWGSASSAQGSAIQLVRDVPFAHEGQIADNIVQECLGVGTKLSHYLHLFATQQGVEIEVVEEVRPSAGGRVLVVEITDAISKGAGGLGHAKSMTARAQLYANGQLRHSEEFVRRSGGGMFGRWKSSCSVLGRCSKALGKDIAVWLSRLD
jgi:hypothetical protein